MVDKGVVGQEVRNVIKNIISLLKKYEIDIIDVE